MPVSANGLGVSLALLVLGL